VVVSNLGVNNFDNAGTVLRECRRVLRPSGRMLISTNLVGHMAEFYDAYRDVLNALDLRQHLDALESHIAHRATVDGVLAMFASAGFADTQVHTGSFRLRYADGTALLRHYFIGLGFLPAWRAIVPPEDAQRVLDAVERELNRRAAETGDLALTIPMACFSAQKKAQ
jgi:SAM-dependent methyltransferase